MSAPATRQRRMAARAHQPIGTADVRAAFERAGAAVLADLAAAPAAVRRFFELVFSPTGARNGNLLAAALGLKPGTLNSRLGRVGLPSSRTYVATARLAVAADLFARFPASAADVANALDYSSPNAFARTVKLMLGLTASEFREQLGGDRMLERFRAELVTPHLNTLHSLHLSGLTAGAAVPRA